MKTWKVILATLVIFLAGFGSGMVLTRKGWLGKIVNRTKTSEAPPGSWMMQRPEFVHWMARALELNPKQKERVEEIMRSSQERLKPLRELIDPVMQEELKRTREEVNKELTPEQQKKFEEMLKRRPRKPDGTPGGPPPGPDRNRSRDGTGRGGPGGPPPGLDGTNRFAPHPPEGGPLRP